MGNNENGVNGVFDYADFQYGHVLRKVTGTGPDLVVPEPICGIYQEAFAACVQPRSLVVTSTTANIGEIFRRLWLPDLKRLVVRFKEKVDTVKVSLYLIFPSFPELELLVIETDGDCRIMVSQANGDREKMLRISGPEITSAFVSPSMDSGNKYRCIDLCLPRLDFSCFSSEGTSKPYTLYLLGRLLQYPELYPLEMESSAEKWAEDPKIQAKLIKRCKVYNDQWALLWLALHFKVPPEIYDELQEMLESENRPDKMDALLQKKNEYYDLDELAEQKEREEEEAFLDPTNPKLFKKTWKWEKLKNGTLKLVSYKGSDPIVYIPAYIGKNKVSVLGNNAFNQICFVNGTRVKQSSLIEEIYFPFGVRVEPRGLVFMSSLRVLKWEDGKRRYLSPKDRVLTTETLKYCYSLEEVVMPQIEEVDDLVFLGCHELRRTLPLEQLKRIGERAYEQSGIEGSLVIPKSLKLGAGAFMGTQISSVEFEQGARVVTNNLFSYCKKLTSVTIPCTIETIGADAFWRSALRELIIRDPEDSKLAVLMESAFSFSDLESITLPESVARIEKDCFKECKKLTDVSLGNRITEIPEGCFDCCRSLVNIKLPPKLISIGDRAFCNTGITSLVLPNTVRSIGKEAFSLCSRLQSIQIPRGCTVAKDAIAPEVTITWAEAD